MFKGKSEEKALRNLKNRVDLLARGIVLPDESIPVIHLQSVQGGAGPRGVACYVGDAPGSYFSQMSLVIYPKDHYLAQYALPTTWWLENNPEDKKEKRRIVRTQDRIFLEEVPFNWGKKWFHRPKTAYLVKARLHPYRTYSLSLYRGCRHLEQHEGCTFCTNSLLVEKFNLPKLLPDRLNLKYLKLAKSYNPVRSVTLTSGTLETPERTVRELLPLIELIRAKTGLSIHVQIEPIFDQTLMKNLSEVTDSIGIFLESFDEKVRQKICPGKARMFTPEDYLRSWEIAASCFGQAKVLTTNLIGFDEDYETVVRGIEKAARVGVITSILLVRVGSPHLGDFIPSYLGQEDKVLQLHKELGKILVKNSIDNISSTNSGCLGCHGCSATREAVMWARIAAGRNS
ncbi:MAG: radical SAM protein [bacterium]